MNKLFKILMIIVMLFAASAAVYALTNNFKMKSQIIELNKKDIFEFNLNTEVNLTEVGPGESFDVAPDIYNDATESIYAFISLKMPSTNQEPLYVYEIDNESWIEVETVDDIIVYAYANNGVMTAIDPGQATVPLTNSMTMRDITNAEYAGIEDISFTITGYAIGTEDIDTDPINLWSICRDLGNN